MKNKKILVVLGGTSGEREISKKSGQACKKALINIGYKVSTFDPKIKSLNLINKKKQILYSMLYMVKMEKTGWHKVFLNT